MDRQRINIWWGPPKKFTVESKDRKISWLELFYDLVYVIVISRITHILASHTDWMGLNEFFYLFLLAFWGWANGSQYHDLHGSPGIRTRFMTLWQMMAVAVLAVALNSPPETLFLRTTIALIILQGYITYLWWSVGIYDKEHRRLSRPYIGCYLASFILLIVNLYTSGVIQSIIFWIIPVLNYFPPFFRQFRADDRFAEFSLSSGMTERLGLITIIVFGENILGVINGVNDIVDMTMKTWLVFGLGILIVFALWWIYFSIVADREVCKGFWRAQLFILSFVPILASLGAVGATFSVVMLGHESIGDHHVEMARIIFGSGLAIFLWSVVIISKLLIYPPAYESARKTVETLLMIAGLIILIINLACLDVDLIFVFLGTFVVLLLVVIKLVRSWFKIELLTLAQSS
jgi:low temperature requirement protein LtrA